MIILQKLEWSNCFSYGEDNCINFTENPLTQLMGPNGAGKTSIALLIQEVLYGKNSKNIKKQDIANNKSGIKGYEIKLYFSKIDNLKEDKYLIHLNRRSSLKLKLYENDKDISSHSSLDTYKTIAQIIGISDFKVFCQLIYQHSTDSLDFLTATDTNRKKFLINLLQLEKYIQLHEHFKKKVQEMNASVQTLTGSVSTINSWIEQHKNTDFSKKEYKIEIPLPDEFISRREQIKSDIDNITVINRKINANNSYLKQLEELDENKIKNSAPVGPKPTSQELHTEISILVNEINKEKTVITKLEKAKGTCPACLQEVAEDKKTLLMREAANNIEKAEAKINDLKLKLNEAKKLETEINSYNIQKQEFERLTQLIDKSIPTETLDIIELKKELMELEDKIDFVRTENRKVQEHNKKAEAHNSKIKVILEQLEEHKQELRNKKVNLTEKEIILDMLELLKKTFSTNGLVSYKIESSVKELEKEINKYLSSLTYFQIYFKLEGEKLNIEVLDDNNNITSVSNLSSGEKARVNIATILAIRKILSNLTSTRLNLLFLDEVIGVIDSEGKEQLSEILLSENLNTFIVSHDWNHPLIPKINIIKEKYMSRVENG